MRVEAPRNARGRQIFCHELNRGVLATYEMRAPDFLPCRPGLRFWEVRHLASIQRLASRARIPVGWQRSCPLVSPAMARKLRYTPDGGASYEITCRTIHSRFLFRPTRRLNEIIVGVLARAKRRYGVKIAAFCCLSNHFLCGAAHNTCYGEWLVMQSWLARPSRNAGKVGGDCA